MTYRTFLFWNALGGICWGTGFTLAGYFAGKSYERVISTAGKASTIIIVLVVVVVAALWSGAGSRSTARRPRRTQQSRQIRLLRSRPTDTSSRNAY